MIRKETAAKQIKARRALQTKVRLAILAIRKVGAHIQPVTPRQHGKIKDVLECEVETALRGIGAHQDALFSLVEGPGEAA